MSSSNCNDVTVCCYEVGYKNHAIAIGGSPPEILVMGYFKSKAHIPHWMQLDVYKSDYYITEMPLQEAKIRLDYKNEYMSY